MTTLETVLYPRPVRWLKQGLIFGGLLLGLSALPIELYLAVMPSLSPPAFIDDVAYLACTLWAVLIAGFSVEPVYDMMLKRQFDRED